MHNSVNETQNAHPLPPNIVYFIFLIFVSCISIRLGALALQYENNDSSYPSTTDLYINLGPLTGITNFFISILCQVTWDKIKKYSGITVSHNQPQLSDNQVLFYLSLHAALIPTFSVGYAKAFKMQNLTKILAISASGLGIIYAGIFLLLTTAKLINRYLLNHTIAEDRTLVATPIPSSPNLLALQANDKKINETYYAQPRNEAHFSIPMPTS